jgi:hypothetical protein
VLLARLRIPMGLWRMVSLRVIMTMRLRTGLSPRSAVRHAVACLPAEDQAKVAVRDLPANAFRPKGRR